MNRLLGVLLALCTSAFVAGCGGDDDHPPTPTQNIAETAQSLAKTDADPDGFSILLAAVGAADPAVAAALTGSSKLTLFAPTNAAFGALLTELGVTKAQLLANTALLNQVLTYHVVDGEVRKAAVPIGSPIASLEGGVFKVDSANNTLTVTDERNRSATITSTDVLATNGVIHVIDKVILPGDKDIVATAQSLPQFSVLVEAVVAAGLTSTLQGTGPFTVFAPTNDAFTALLAELGVTKAALLADTALLTQVLTYHVVPGRVFKANVPVNAPITTVQTGTFTVGSNLAITDANSRTSNIVATDVLARNGVIHVIDKVILPPAP